MATLQFAYLKELEEYLSSGRLVEDFFYSGEERRYEMLEFLEKLMDVAELADESATRIIFRTASREKSEEEEKGRAQAAAAEC